MSEAITDVTARELYDGRGQPTLEACVTMESGATGRAMVPSGASTGRHEAVEVRDGGTRLRGQGVRRAVAAVREILAPRLIGHSALLQADVDAILIAADNTPGHAQLGANSLLAVSLAVAHAAAAHRHVPLWRHFADLAGTLPRLPLPMINLFSGGRHAPGGADLQDYLIVPRGATNLEMAIEMAVNVRLAAADLLRTRKRSTLLADEGGFGPRLTRNSIGFLWSVEAIERAGLVAGADVSLALDVAASQLVRDGQYVLRRPPQTLSTEALTTLVESWVECYPLVSVEDPLDEDDWVGWAHLTARLGSRIQVVGDDLFTTHTGRLQQGVRVGAANAVLVKCNQVGTLSETIGFVQLAKQTGYRTIASARSGETEEHWLADLAVGLGVDQIKIGATRTAERTAKYNQLLRIADELPPNSYAGRLAIDRGPTANGHDGGDVRK